LSEEEFHLQTLYQLGLTQNQAKLYLTLLDIGKSTAGLLAKETKMARQEVYRILQELYDIGLIEKTISNPMEFQSVGIQDCVSILMLEKTRQFEKVQLRLEKLFYQYRNNKTSSSKGEFKFQLIPGKKLANAQREKMLEDAKESVQLITNTRRFSQGMDYFFNLTELNLKERIEVKIIVTAGEEEKDVTAKLQRLESYPSFFIKFITDSKANLLIVDKKEALLTLYPKADLMSPLLWTNHPELLGVYQDYFNCIWNVAQTIPLKDKLIDIDNLEKY